MGLACGVPAIAGPIRFSAGTLFDQFQYSSASRRGKCVACRAGMPAGVGVTALIKFSCEPMCWPRDLHVVDLGVLITGPAFLEVHCVGSSLSFRNVLVCVFHYLCKPCHALVASASLFWSKLSEDANSLLRSLRGGICCMELVQAFSHCPSPRRCEGSTQ